MITLRRLLKRNAGVRRKIGSREKIGELGLGDKRNNRSVHYVIFQLASLDEWGSTHPKLNFKFSHLRSQSSHLILTAATT